MSWNYFTFINCSLTRQFIMFYVLDAKSEYAQKTNNYSHQMNVVEIHNIFLCSGNTQYFPLKCSRVEV